MEDRKRKKKQPLNATSTGAGLNELTQRNGEAASQIQQAYKGKRYDSAGNDLNHQGRNMKDIGKYKLNPDYVDQNIKQQAGFDAELIKEARDNKNAILKGDTNRTRTSDGLGNTNDQTFDHVVVDKNGNSIQGSGSQMKFMENPTKAVEKLVNDPKWDKYRGGPMDLPSDQVKTAKAYCDEQATKLRKQAENRRNTGDEARAKKLEIKANRYDETKKQIRSSGVSTDESIQARVNAKKYTIKETFKDSHNAGLEAAKGAAIVSTFVATAQNIYSVIFEEKSIDNAVSDIAKTTYKTTEAAYIVGHGGTMLKSVMHSSKNSIVRKIGNTSAPAMIVTGAIEITMSLKKYASGEIDSVELLEELGEKGTGMVAAGMGAGIGTSVGTLILPGIGSVVGGIVGGMIGYTVNSILYNSTLQILKEVSLSYERRLEIEAMSRESIFQMKIYQNAITEKAEEKQEQFQQVYDTFFENVQKSILSNDINTFFDTMQFFGSIFDCNQKFSTFEEFDEFMSDNNTELII